MQLIKTIKQTFKTYKEKYDKQKKARKGRVYINGQRVDIAALDFDDFLKLVYNEDYTDDEDQ